MLYEIENNWAGLTANPINNLGLRPVPNVHSHLELIYLTEGATIVSLNGKDFLLERGDFFLAFPNQIHLYHDTNPVQGFIAIFSPDLFTDLTNLFSKKIPAMPVIKKTQYSFDPFPILEGICKNNTYFEQISAKGYLLTLLGKLLPLMELVTDKSTPDTTMRILQFCMEHYTEPLTLELTADKLQLSKYHISHIFKQRSHMSFPTFINYMRIEYACTLLERGNTITDTAFASGFSSIRSFNRAFLQNMNMTPSEYVKTLD